MRVLVTGLGGFTGRYVGAALRARGHDVVGLRSRLEDAGALAAEVAATRPDVVCHLAAVAHVAHDDLRAFYDVNLLGTRNLLHALVDLPNLQAALLASSANIYGNTGGMLDESCAPTPRNDYAVSKAAMELLAGTFSEQVPIVLLRPFNDTGVGQSTAFLIPKIVRHFRDRLPEIRLGNTDVARDFSDVRAVAAAYAGLAEAPPVGDVVNIASGRTWTLDQILDAAVDLTGHRPRIRVDPALVRGNEVKSLSGNPSRLRARLPDWKPIPFDETLRWMLASDD